MSEQKRVGPRLVALQRKAQHAGGLFFGDLMVDDDACIETRHSIYTFKILSSESGPHRRVQLTSSNPRFRGPLNAVIKGTAIEGTHHKGWVFMGHRLELEFENDPNPLVLSVTRLIRVNGFQIL